MIFIINVNNLVCLGDEFFGSFDVMVNDGCGVFYNIFVGGIIFFNVLVGFIIIFGGLNVVVGGIVYMVNFFLVLVGGCQFNIDQMGCVFFVLVIQMLMLFDSQVLGMDVIVVGGVDLGLGVVFIYILLEGECGVQLFWFVFLFDNCGGLFDIDFIVSVINNNFGVFLIVLVIQDVVDVVYVVNIFVVVGMNVVMFSVIDENGNNMILIFIIEVLDVCIFEIYGFGDMQV